MVQNVLKVVYKEVRGLHQAAYVLAVLTFGSQILALIRDRLLAHQFGAGMELDLYYTAFRIPDVLYVIFASTLSIYVLIPFVAERISGTDSTRARHLLSQIFSLFLIFYSALALIIAFAAPFIVTQFFPGFIEQKDSLVLLMRILLLQPLLLGVSSLFGVITQFGHRFILYAVSPLVYNLGIIFGVLVLFPHYGVGGLAWGVVIGALGHLLVQLPFVRESELSPKFLCTFSFKEILEVLTTSLPRALTLSLHQLVLLGLVGLASIMAVGSVSVFQFAFNLQSVPLAIIGVSYSVAAFPRLAQLYAEGKYELFSSHIITAMRHIIFWSLPAIALLIVIRAQFVRVVLGSGAFDWNDTRLTAAVLAIFAFSLVSQAIHLLLVRALYAVGNTRLPFYITLFSSVLALLSAIGVHVLMTQSPALAAFIANTMRLEGISGIEVLALPIGYSIALIVHSIVLLLLSQRKLGFSIGALIPLTLRSLCASLVAGVVAYLTLNFVVTGIETDTLLTIFLQGLLAGVMGIIAGLTTYYLLRTPELNEVYRAIHRRIMKTDVVIPQDEDHLAV
jgi:putative peptidoglycan lipid II flippase